MMVGLSLVGPGAAYGLHQSLVDEAASILPALTFHPGADYASARGAGLAGEFQSLHNGAAYAVTLSGLAGSRIVIDDLVEARVDPGVASYGFQIDQGLRGTLTKPTEFVMRAWSGPSPPQSNDDPGVCAVVDFTSSEHAGIHDRCTTNVHLQFVLELPHSAKGESTVSIRPTGIVFGVPSP
jgi:hypothetical protein